MTQSIFCTKNEKNKQYLKKWILVSKIVLTYCEKKSFSDQEKLWDHQNKLAQAERFSTRELFRTAQIKKFSSKIVKYAFSATRIFFLISLYFHSIFVLFHDE